VSGQKKSHSIFESITNVCVGFGINFTANMLLFPLFGWHISAEQNVLLGIIYTGISIVRSYILRRVFNRIMVLGRK
jgi:hypothetical protein